MARVQPPPLLGDLDLHLFGEGRHERLWEVMGAHLREVDGEVGVSFSVWAPNARRVSVVGDFNGWDGESDPMAHIGSSGVWHAWVPDVQAGARYKFELVTSDGGTVQKADPFAFEAEVPPATASVVNDSAYRWSDASWLEQRALTTPLSR